MHMKSTTTKILEYMDDLLLLQAFSSISHQQIEQCSLRAELVHYVNLLQSISSASQLSLMNQHDVFMAAELSLTEK